MVSPFKHRVILVLILTVILTYAFFAEKIEHRNGMGYDGAFYGDFTIHFKEYIRNHTINKYYFQRLFVPFIISNLFSILHINLSIPNVILAYSIANLVFICIGVYFFFKISNFLKLSKSIEVIGFAALFFCFPVLKLCLYYPILMDIPAFAVAIVIVNFYLKRNIYLFFFFILIGSFIYPTFILLSILYIFDFKKSDENNDPEQSRIVPFLNKVNGFHLLICFALPAFFIWIYIVLIWLSSFELLTEQLTVNMPGTLYIWFSFLLTLIYVVSLNYFPKERITLQRFLKSINYSGIILGTLVFILIQLMIISFASKEVATLTIKNYFHAVLCQTVKNPLNFLVAHVFYFGLAPILSLFIIKDIKREVINFGFGMILFFNMAIFFSIGSESRQLINYYPFLILLLLYSLNKYWEVSMKFSCVFGAICIGLSHFWYTINKGIMPDAETDYDSCLKFPLQRYFMFQGPWVNDTMYKIHLAVVCFLLVLLWFLVKKTGLVKRKLETVTAVPFL